MVEPKIIILPVAGGVAVAAAVAAVMYRVRRRRRLAAMPLPEHLRRIVVENVGIYRHLPSELRVRLEGLTNVFLAEKNFEGCGGQTVDDEIRVTVAALAGVLLLHAPGRECYPSLRQVLIYPGSYVVTGPRRIGTQVIDEGEEVLDGSSYESGTMILGWAQVRDEGRSYGGGANVVWHECAHFLDYESGISEGVPALPRV
ncbi:MAG: zinc-dependent peptidase, partial [Victivallales bacterium]|nr:zinc-dependent peptidase [Victivallales bacterium]